MGDQGLTRRQVIGALGTAAAGSLAGAAMAGGEQITPTTPPGARTTFVPASVPRADLVNTLEFEEQAKRTLAPALFATIAGGDRAPFDRITLRPRMMIPTVDLDLSLALFGHQMFAPIIVGPVAGQQRFHPEGELATALGAAAANATMIVSSQSSLPVAELTKTKASLWFQVFASDPAARAQIDRAVAAGCQAVCITVGAMPVTGRGRVAARSMPMDWTAVSALRRGLTVPVIVKGITTAAAARQALDHDVQGIVASNYGGTTDAGGGALILDLSAIVAAAGGKVPVLVDGSFRRGTDIIKALAFGAKAVLVGRPVMWGLAAYGADGVQGVLETLQTELGRYMSMCGKPTLAAVDASLVRVHAARPAPGVTRG